MKTEVVDLRGVEDVKIIFQFGKYLVYFYDRKDNVLQVVPFATRGEAMDFLEEVCRALELVVNGSI